MDDDKFLNEGFAMLSSNSPGGVAQFWDRDAPAEMAKVSMEGFQEFMVKPDNLDRILADRFLGYRRSVLIGGVFFATGFTFAGLWLWVE